MEEKLLIQACCKNDRRAQEYLYRHYFPTIRRMCERYTKDEDQLVNIVNNGFLKVFKGIGSYSGSGSFEGWIRRTVFHALSDYFRKENKYTKNTFFEVPETAQQSEALQDLYFLDLMDLVEDLPDATCQVFKMYAIDGYTHKEIGKRMNMSDGTSKWHLHEARKKLKLMIMKRDKILRHAR